MIFGAHVVVYSKDADADRAFLMPWWGRRWSKSVVGVIRDDARGGDVPLSLARRSVPPDRWQNRALSRLSHES
jgi:hypothetical protein